MNEPRGAYAVLAPLYDRLTDRDIDYSKWCEDYCTLAGLTRGQTVLEAACGTGKMTAQLLRRGLRVTGTDISPQMLTVAGETCRKLGTTPVLALCDMRTLKTHRPVDAVLCTCDGVNYLTQDADAAAFFSSAFAALKPGGILAFDISSAQKLRGMDGQVYYDDRQDVTCLWTNALDGDVLQMELTFFVRKDQALYQRVDETHRQRAYAPEKLETLLMQTGFEAVQIVLPSDTPAWRRGRVHITARKPAP